MTEGYDRAHARDAKVSVPSEHAYVLSVAQAMGGKNITAAALAAEAWEAPTPWQQAENEAAAPATMRFFEQRGIAVVVQKPAPGRCTAWSINGHWRVES